MIVMRFFLCFLLLPLFAIADVNRYSGTTSVYIPYANAERNQDLERSPTIYMGFNGSGNYEAFVMDTGSVGIIASSDIFTPAPGAINLGPGRQFYSSSGIIEEGTWWTATQQFYDRNGTLVATSNVPVLQVTSVSCSENARSCTPGSHPKGIRMMGIGFARGSEDPHKTPAFNPFLNLQTVRHHGALTKLPQDWCNGYVVTKHGIHLGLTAENTAGAGFVKLESSPEHSTKTLREWKAAPATLTVNGVSGKGTVLMDTGVGTAYLSFPEIKWDNLVTCEGSSLVQCAPQGTKIGIFLPDNVNPVARYGFVIGKSGNRMQPHGVHVVKHPYVFLNTSRHVLHGLSYIYDNTNGYVGYLYQK